jgi:predicted GIY-YIG superfamily endonuclease
MSRVAGKPYFVYVLWSQCGRCFYIGISEDPEHRQQRHNGSENRGWTARHRPWELVYWEKCEDYNTARRRENELKRQKGGIGFFEKTGLDPGRFGRGS